MKCQEYRTLFEIQNIRGLDSYFMENFFDRIYWIIMIFFFFSFRMKLKKTPCASGATVAIGERSSSLYNDLLLKINQDSNGMIVYMVPLRR